MSSINLTAVMLTSDGERSLDVSTGPMIIEFAGGVEEISYEYLSDAADLYLSDLPLSLTIGDTVVEQADFTEDLYVGLIHFDLGALSTTGFVFEGYEESGEFGVAAIDGLNPAQLADISPWLFAELLSLLTLRAQMVDADDPYGPGNTFSLSDFETPADMDILTGDGGANILSNTGGAAIVAGLSGADMITGYAGDDALLGGLGRDTVNGGGGDDVLSGFGGRDLLIGGGGDDIMSGGSSRDVLKGNKGNDILFGGEDNDKLFGGKHADAFVFVMDNDNGRDVIRDFGHGRDSLVFIGMDDMSDADFIETHVTETERGLWIDFGTYSGAEMREYTVSEGVLLRDVFDTSELEGHLYFI